MIPGSRKRALKKDTRERTETVADKVRSTEVKLEDERGRAGAQPTRKVG